MVFRTDKQHLIMWIFGYNARCERCTSHVHNITVCALKSNKEAQLRSTCASPRPTNTRRFNRIIHHPPGHSDHQPTTCSFISTLHSNFYQTQSLCFSRYTFSHLWNSIVLNRIALWQCFYSSFVRKCNDQVLKELQMRIVCLKIKVGKSNLTSNLTESDEDEPEKSGTLWWVKVLSFPIIIFRVRNARARVFKMFSFYTGNHAVRLRERERGTGTKLKGLNFLSHIFIAGMRSRLSMLDHLLFSPDS